MYTAPERINLKTDPNYSEKWVQEIIANDPTILGLGELVLRDKERIQPKAGRLDLLLQDAESLRRYEVELQLGSTDETHIIRTVEYWDIERKRYPQYDHCAVIIAEDVTSRFLNVLSLFNGSIPIIALQMKAFRVGDHVTLIFTKVMDEMVRGLVDEDEAAEAAPADRPYWESRSAKNTLCQVDQMLHMLQEIDSSLKLKFNKYYIGLERDGQAFNFVQFRPRKKHIVLLVKLEESDEISKKIEASDLDSVDYDIKRNRYKISLGATDAETNQDVLKEIFKLAYERRIEN